MPFQSNPTSHHPIVKNKENQGEREAEALNNQEQPEHPTGTLTRARPDSGKLTRKEILRLQTTIGNRAVSRILARKIQRRAIQRHQNAAPAPAQPNGPLIEKGFETETEGGEVNRLTTPNGGAADPSENKTRMPIDD